MVMSLILYWFAGFVVVGKGFRNTFAEDQKPLAEDHQELEIEFHWSLPQAVQLVPVAAQEEPVIQNSHGQQQTVPVHTHQMMVGPSGHGQQVSLLDLAVVVVIVAAQFYEDSQAVVCKISRGDLVIIS